jgi:AcrR family transcriptional regulator
MDSKTLELIERSALLFMHYGVKSVTMDDLARELGISKKTLYKHFEDKNQLVFSIMQLNINKDKKSCIEIKEAAKNAIDGLFRTTRFVMDKFRNIHPSVFYDLRKYHPDAWQLLQDHKWNFIIDLFRQNIERGKKEGLYRSNINTEIISRLHIATTDAILGTEVFPTTEFQYDQVFSDMMDIHIHGLVSHEGYTYLQERLKTEHDA